MPLTMTLKGEPLLEVNLYVIFSKQGIWQGKWGKLQDHEETKPVVDLFSYTGIEEYHHAVYGYPVPMMQSLGVPPLFCLEKLQHYWDGCNEKNYCLMYSDMCYLRLGMPRCFEPGIQDLEVIGLVRRILLGWADNYYWTVVKED